MLGWERLQDAEHGAPEPVGARGSRAPSPLATGESENLPFSGISAQALSFALSLRARGSGCPSGAEGPWHSPGEPKAGAAIPCHPAGAAIPCHPFPRGAPVPGQESPNRHRITFIPSQKNHRIKSVPLKRTEKCRFPRFGRSSYTCLILPVFPRFPRGALIAQSNPESLPTGRALCREPEQRGRRRGPRLFPS